MEKLRNNNRINIKENNRHCRQKFKENFLRMEKSRLPKAVINCNPRGKR